MSHLKPLVVIRERRKSQYTATRRVPVRMNTRVFSSAFDQDQSHFSNRIDIDTSAARCTDATSPPPRTRISGKLSSDICAARAAIPMRGPANEVFVQGCTRRPKTVHTTRSGVVRDAFRASTATRTNHSPPQISAPRSGQSPLQGIQSFSLDK